MSTQHEKIGKFRALHAGPAFVIANAWDTASAKILAGLARLIHSRTACCKKVRTLNGFDVWGHGIFCHGSFLPKPLENREIMWISEDAVNKTG